MDGLTAAATVGVGGDISPSTATTRGNPGKRLLRRWRKYVRPSLSVSLAAGEPSRRTMCAWPLPSGSLASEESTRMAEAPFVREAHRVRPKKKHFVVGDGSSSSNGGGGGDETPTGMYAGTPGTGAGAGAGAGADAGWTSSPACEEAEARAGEGESDTDTTELPSTPPTGACMAKGRGEGTSTSTVAVTSSTAPGTKRYWCSCMVLGLPF